MAKKVRWYLSFTVRESGAWLKAALDLRRAALGQEVFGMEIEEFERAIKDKDFALGDSFWINDIEFEVVNKR